MAGIYQVFKVIHNGRTCINFRLQGPLEYVLEGRDTIEILSATNLQN